MQELCRKLFAYRDIEKRQRTTAYGGFPWTKRGRELTSSHSGLPEGKQSLPPSLGAAVHYRASQTAASDPSASAEGLHLSRETTADRRIATLQMSATLLRKSWAAASLAARI